MMKLKCRKCAHFYRTMVGADGAGYNPAAYCHCYEDTGKPANILTQECFEPRKKRARNKKTQKGSDVQVQELMESKAH